jgi:RNA polymerase sigma-70 factor (ECF subfamily)
MMPEIGGIPDYVWGATDNNNDADQQIRYRELVTLIIALPPPYRVVFNLYAIDGYSHLEISEMLNIPVGTSKSNLSRARLILQKNIKELEKVKLCGI